MNWISRSVVSLSVVLRPVVLLSVALRLAVLLSVALRLAVLISSVFRPVVLLPVVVALLLSTAVQASDPEIRIVASAQAASLAREIQEELAVRGIPAKADGHVTTDPRAVVWVHEDHVEITVLDPKASGVSKHHEIAVKSGAEAERLVVAREAAEWLRTRLFPPALAAGGGVLPDGRKGDTGPEGRKGDTGPEGRKGPDEAPPTPSDSDRKTSPGAKRAAVQSEQSPTKSQVGESLPTAAGNRRGVPLAVTIGPALAAPSGGVPAVWGAYGSIAYRASERWGADVWGFLPLSQPTIQGGLGSAIVRTALVGLGPQVSLAIGKVAIFEAGAGAALAALISKGQEVPEGAGSSVVSAEDSVVVAMPYVRAGIRVRVLGPVGLRFDLLGGAPIPEVDVLFVGQSVAHLATPVVMAAVSAEIDFGSL